MSEYEIRKPIQKRSIEKKEKIIESGFELICEKGYYNTNTAEIAKNTISEKINQTMADEEQEKQKQEEENSVITDINGIKIEEE